MRSVMICGFVLVMIGCFTGNLLVLGIGVLAQTIGTVGCLDEGRM